MSNQGIISAIQGAIGAHGKWKFNLKVAISNGKSDFEVAKVQRDDLCDFGKWLHGDSISQEEKNSKPYEVVSRLHREFHRCAAEVLKHAVNDNQEYAKELLGGEFSERSEILVKALNKWKEEL
jgi:hypothetical protein